MCVLVYWSRWRLTGFMLLSCSSFSSVWDFALFLCFGFYNVTCFETVSGLAEFHSCLNNAVSLHCWSGDFLRPGSVTISETLFWQSERGAHTHTKVRKNLTGPVCSLRIDLGVFSLCKQCTITSLRFDCIHHLFSSLIDVLIVLKHL